MKHRASPDPAPLREPDAERLLARAAELDAAAAASASLTELRAAASEAGISARAFDAALAELRAGETAVARPGRRRRRTARVVAAAVALMVGGALAVSRARTPTPAAAGAPVVEESILLRCLAPGDAAELIRPLLDLPSNAIVARPAQAPHVLTVRATPAQLERVRRAIEEGEARSPACAARPATP